MYLNVGASIPPRRKNNQSKRSAPAPIIAVQRREGLRYIVRQDPRATAFESFDAAVWLINFLG